MALQGIKTSEELIKETLNKEEYSSITGKFIAPFNESNFSEKKLMNASRFIGDGVDAMNVVGFVDTTLFGSAKEGVLFTGTNLFYRDTFETSQNIPYDQVKSAEFKIEETTGSNGSKKTTTEVVVLLNDSTKKSIHFYDDKINKVIADILNGIAQEETVIDSTEQLIQLNDLGDNTISVYLKVVMNFLKEDDGFISPDEYKELIGIMTRLNIKPAISNSLRTYRLEKGISEPTECLIYQLETLIPKGSQGTIFQALANDLLTVRKKNLEDWKSDKDYLRYAGLLGVSEDQVEFFVKKLKQDERIINDRIDDNTIKKTANELMAVGGAAGVSLAALAVTGGVSTGVWGGLLTLGTASTGGMLLGLAAIAGVGYASYKGIKYFSGTSELEKYGIRMGMLQEKIKQMQLSQNYLIEDMNAITDSLYEALSEKDKIVENFAKIQKLLKLSKNLKDSSEEIHNEGQKSQREVFLAQIPSILDVNKCNELLNRTRYGAQFKEFIYRYYETDENGQYCLVDNIEDEVLKKLCGVIDQIGYNDTRKSLAAQGNVMMNKVKGLFSD